MSELGPSLEEKETLEHRKTIIFSDIDGTILDLQNYSFEAARPALEEILLKEVPLIFVTSKTQAEVENLKEDFETEGMAFDHPYIVENGGGIFIPDDYFSVSFDEIMAEGLFRRKTAGGEWLTFGGLNYEELRQKLKVDIASKLTVEVIGFGDMTDEELAQDSGLTLDQARLAKQREFDEPFKMIPENLEEAQKITEMIKQQGLEYHKGGRYHHISNPRDKRKAVEILLSLYKKQFGEIFTLGLGDSLADEEFVALCDEGKIVKNQEEFNQIINHTLTEDRK